MTTIGLVSAGLLTFPQGLGLVFGANVGTTGTGWLVALIGVRVSVILLRASNDFRRSLIKLLGRGRASAAGAALAGFALVLFGLTTLQQGMGGLAERCIRRTCRPSWGGRSRLDARACSAGDAGRGWPRDDGSDVVVDGGHRRHAVGLLRRCDRVGTRLCADHRAEHRNSDQFRDGGHWRQRDRQEISGRLCPVQGDRRRDRTGVVPFHHGSDSPRVERHRWRDPSGCLPYGV